MNMARLAATLAVLGSARCDESPGGGGGGGDGGGGGGLVNIVETHPDAEPIVPATDCTVTTGDASELSAMHVTPCAEVTFATAPPCTGTHYSAWADFGVYDAPVPWGFLVHSMEHGAVVMAYGCGDSCPDVVAAMESMVAEFPDDPACTGGDPHRLIVVPDPTLEVPIAAAAWGRVYRATCLDPSSLEEFVTLHYANSPENLCAPGRDDSATGWCP